MYNNLDKKEYQRTLKNLEKLGLTEKESLIYVYLLGRSVEVGSSKIVTATSLHGQYVYDALGSLEGKGLVKHVIKNGRKKWSASPLNRLESLVEEKRIIANDVKDVLEKISIHQHEQEFEVYQGEDQFVTHELQMVEEAEIDSWRDIIGGQGSRFAEVLGETRELYNQKSTEKRIKTRFIGTMEQYEYLKETKVSRPNFDYRIMPGFHTSAVSTTIYPNAVLFQIYGSPILVFKIRSKIIASNYKTFFESLWGLCSK